MSSRTSPLWMRTVSGWRVDVLHPRVEDVDLEDIAHGLSMQCRYNGHVPRFYSVAQHSLAVAELVPDPNALLHDAAEAYLGDVIRPVKRALLSSGYARMESAFMEVIRRALAVRAPSPELVERIHVADQRVLAREMKQILHINPAEWGLHGVDLAPPIYLFLEPEEARKAYLARFGELMEGGA